MSVAAELAPVRSWHLRPPTELLAVRTPDAPPFWSHLSPIALLLGLLRHGGLIRQFAWREIRGRYQGSYLGLLWTLVMPAALVLAYTFVFQFVMKARWGQSADESPLAFGLTLFTGMLVYTLFSESTSRAPGLMLAHPNFVKKVVFPLEILPLTTLLGTLAHLGVSLFVVVTAYALLVQPPGWQALWFPLLLLPYVAFLLGLGWLLSALGVFVRDLGPTVGLIAHVLVFLTPVFYPLGAVPAPWRTLMQLNPLAVFVDNARRVLLWDQPPDWWPLAIASVVGLIVMQLGYALFMRSKRGFAEVV